MDKRRVRKAFGARVRELRTKGGLSQERLAFVSGLHRTYIGGIERGERNPTLVTMVRLAAALDVEPAALLKVKRKRGRS